MSKPLVDSSANGVDRARLCLTLRSRRFLTHALPQTRAYRPRQQTPERCRRPIPPPHLRSAPSAAVQIPIALSSADHRGNPRGFLLWGLSNACPPTSAVHPSPPLRAGIGQPLPESELPLRLKKDSSGLLSDRKLLPLRIGVNPRSVSISAIGTSSSSCPFRRSTRCTECAFPITAHATGRPELLISTYFSKSIAANEELCERFETIFSASYGPLVRSTHVRTGWYWPLFGHDRDRPGIRI